MLRRAAQLLQRSRRRHRHGDDARAGQAARRGRGRGEPRGDAPRVGRRRRAGERTGASSRQTTEELLSVRRVPVGPVAAFVPWNFPAGGPMRKIAAALARRAAPSSSSPPRRCPGPPARWPQAFHDAGLPAGVLNVVFGVPTEISPYLIADPRIRFVAFTGSVPVGKHIAGLAAAVMKPAIMELGGHAPVIVCADTRSRRARRGPACRRRWSTPARSAPRRAASYVHALILDEFTAAFVAAAERSRSAAGCSAGVQMGPMASARRRDAVHRLVADAGSGAPRS